MVSGTESAEVTPVRRTLRGRVSLLGLGVIAAWVLVLTVAFNFVLSTRLSRELDVVLRTRATTAAATVAVSPTGVVTARELGGDEALDSGIWVYAGTRAVERPPGGPNLQAVADSLALQGTTYLNRGDYRFYVLPFVRNGHRYGTVVAAVSSAPNQRARTETFVGSGLVALLVLLGAYPVLRFAAGRALRPVDAMTRQAGEWSAHALTERFGNDQRFREVQTLASTLNGVLDRLSAIVRHERRLSAELSHELRTPLSRIVAETDLLLARPHSAEDLGTAHNAMRESAMAMDRILETLLSAARVDIQDAPGRCDLKPVVAGLVRMRAGADSDPKIVVDIAPSLAVGVDEAIAERILAPILDNACRYATTTVTISARRTSESVIVEIADDGPGVSADLREAIFEPGRRGATDDGHDGAGLGLALARRLARAAAGDVTVVGDVGPVRDDSRFRVRFPPA
ncbi:MAG: Signal transduction histidine kinase [Jatrophihabitans sp.]|nr:Signal transduction histidine kinase [Jatrophihabitans sp.]